jgi:hypothetical protein
VPRALLQSLVLLGVAHATVALNPGARYDRSRFVRVCLEDAHTHTCTHAQAHAHARNTRSHAHAHAHSRFRRQLRVLRRGLHDGRSRFVARCARISL